MAVRGLGKSGLGWAEGLVVVCVFSYACRHRRGGEGRSVIGRSLREQTVGAGGLWMGMEDAHVVAPPDVPISGARP